MSSVFLLRDEDDGVPQVLEADTAVLQRQIVSMADLFPGGSAYVEAGPMHP